jgi:glycosyltransferase involved in cell wall biosynthesis
MDTQPIRDFKYFYTLRKDLLWHAFRRWQHGLALRQERQSGIYEKPAPSHNLKLSTCVITMNAASRIAPLIAHAKTFSDEVVIGVDSKTTDNTFEICQKAGADVVFWIQNDALTCNAGLEQLVKACSGDWIVRLDDDEYLEPQFLKIKDSLMAQDHYTHYKFPRLHISGIEPLRWVNDSYLYPDYQMRLFRNDLTLLQFPGAVGHTSITSKGPKGRIVGTNIVHLNLAINSRQNREAKLERYIVRHQGGWVHPINEYALLFENFAYRIELYQHPDHTFCELLASVVRGQRQDQYAEVAAL